MSDEHGKVPEGWCKSTIGELADIVTGRTPSTKKAELYGGPFPFVKPGDLDGIGPLISAESSLSVSGIEHAPRLPLNSVLVSCIGNLGKSAILGGEASCNQQINAVLPSPALDPNYTYYWSKVIRSWMEENASATTVTILNKGRFQRAPISLPPLNEQRRIVAKIETLQERSRKAREALSEVAPLLEQFRQSLLAAAFRGDLTADWRAENPDVEPASEILTRIRQERRERWEQAELAKYEAKDKRPPKGWKEKYKEPEPCQPEELEILRDPSLPENWSWAPAELIVEPDADIVYGIVQPGKKLEEGVPYVRGKDIVNGVILVDQLLKTSEEIARKYERASLKGGDILLGIIRATKVAIVPEELEGANITQGTARFRPSNIISTNFLAAWLDSPFAQNWLHDHYRGIDMPGLNLRDVRRLPIPIAPLAEQLEVATKLSSSIDSIANAKQQACTSETALSQMDQSILAKAFRGELVPQDPNDEPASALLDRIREQREVAGKKGKKSAKRKKGVPAKSAEPLATETPNVSSYTLVLLKAWGKAVPFPVLEAGLRLMLEPNLQQTIVKPRRGRKKAQAESVPLVHGMDQVYASLTSQGAIRLVGKQAYQLDEESETVQLLLDESLLPLANNAIAAFETLMQRKKLDEEEAGIAISQMVSKPYAATTHV